MSYKVLYRTYRPQTFNDVIGQDVIVKSIQNAISNNRIAHAYLFCGPRGTGKTTVARILAKTLNCLNAKNEPCLRCENCHEISEGNSPDVIEIDAASNNGVDEIREIKDKIKFLPAGAKHKIYIIDEVHMLTSNAFNALLKTLEEPPAHAIFILATTEPHKVIPTILSRCQRYDFKSLTVKDLTNALIDVCVKEDVKYDEKALIEIAKASDGGFRDALSFLDQAISLSETQITEEIAASVTGLLKNEDLLKIANYIEENNLLETLNFIQSLLESGKEISKIISSLVSFYKDVLISKVTNEGQYLDFASNIDKSKLYFNINILNDCYSKLKYGFNLDIYFEVAIIKMVNVSLEELDYSDRISKLEAKFSENISHPEVSGVDSVDSKKLKILEDKFNHLLGELSKLELFKLQDRVKLLESKETSSESFVSNKEDTFKLDKVIEDLELLKTVQNTFRNELENSKLGSLNEDFIGERIEENLKKIKPSLNNSEIENLVKKYCKLYLDVNENKESDHNLKNADDFDYKTYIDNLFKEKSFIDVDERLTKMESTIYNFISSAQPPQIKKERKKVDDKQISIWKDEVVTIDKIKTNVEPRTNFMELSIKTEKDKVKDDKDIQEKIVSEKAVSEKTVSEKIERARKVKTGDENLFARRDDIPARETVKPVFDEKDEVHQNIKVVKTEKEAKVDDFENDADEYERYDVKVLERIMNDSFSSEYANEKHRLQSAWKHLVQLSSAEQRGVAEILSEGEIKVVGNHEFVIIFKTALLCNKVMSRDFKTSALKLIYDLLNTDYNYLALPIKVWDDKRAEYANQYYMGTKHPTLTPINDPELKVSKVVKDEDKILKDIIDVFGDNINIKK